MYIGAVLYIRLCESVRRAGRVRGVRVGAGEGDCKTNICLQYGCCPVRGVRIGPVRGVVLVRAGAVRCVSAVCGPGWRLSSKPSVCRSNRQGR